eukprot:648549-Amphidinium_carterae.1
MVAHVAVLCNFGWWPCWLDAVAFVSSRGKSLASPHAGLCARIRKGSAASKLLSWNMRACGFCGNL